MSVQDVRRGRKRKPWSHVATDASLQQETLWQGAQRWLRENRIRHSTLTATTCQGAGWFLFSGGWLLHLCAGVRFLRFWRYVGSNFRTPAGRSIFGGIWHSSVVQHSFPQKLPEKVWEALVQSQVKFNKGLEKSVHPVSGEGSREEGSGEGLGLGGFGAMLGQVRKALVQSQVRFIWFPEKVPEKVWEALSQGQVWFS